MSKTPITLKPIAGFCIKSSILQPGVYNPPSVKPGPTVLEPQSGPIPVPIGLKVFINIAWDAHVPPPPPGSEQAIQDAMKGEEVDELNPDGWYVPIIVSEGRLDKDKAGSPSLVFDCVYHTSVKSRTLTDPEFKIFLVELALQRIEAQTALVLSRQIKTPNIASKGKLLPRTVLIPSFLTEKPVPGSLNVPTKPLIQEITQPTPIPGPSKTRPTELKGILKPTPTHLTGGAQFERPAWKWSKVGTRLSIVISVPNLERSAIMKTTLDIEPRRFILNIPDYPVVDVNLDLSDAEIVARTPSVTSASLHGVSSEEMHEPNNILTLKRQRDLDVDGATAEWRVGNSTLIIMA